MLFSREIWVVISLLKLKRIFFLRFYLFIHERHRQREKQPPHRELMWDLISGLRDHTLSPRQMLNHLSHPVALKDYFLISR